MEWADDGIFWVCMGLSQYSVRILGIKNNFKSNYKLLSMDVQIQRSQSKIPLCQFTIHFKNHKPTIKSNNKEQNNKIVPKITNIQQDQSPTLTYSVNVFRSNTPKVHPNQANEPINLYSLPNKIINYEVVPGIGNWQDEQHASFQKQIQNISLSRSLIEELLCLEESQNFATVSKKKQLQYFDIQQTQSMQQQNSHNFQQEHSQVVELTQEEKNFFNNFIVASLPTTPKHQDSPFKHIGLDHQASLQLKSNRILQEKRRLIRNFFRPKGSFLKDDKTCCNSYTNIDQIYDSSKKSTESNSQWMRGNQNQVISN